MRLVFAVIVLEESLERLGSVESTVARRRISPFFDESKICMACGKGNSREKGPLRMCWGIKHCEEIVDAIKKHNDEVDVKAYLTLDKEAKEALIPVVLKGDSTGPSSEDIGSRGSRYADCPTATTTNAAGRGETWYHCACVGYDPGKGYAHKLPVPNKYGIIMDLALDDLVKYAVCPNCRRSYEKRDSDYVFSHANDKTPKEIEHDNKYRQVRHLSKQFTSHGKCRVSSFQEDWSLT